ncbi:flavodoxin [Algoriphagus jejuensis]|uniref:Flavodoxin n=1 Tax=Algoriphagus jejuensis TaxID=419934 RepID=A0ABP3YHG3_9BACT
MKYFLLFVFLFSSLSCTGQTEKKLPANPGEKGSDKILIVYLTRTKNTKAVAEMINQEVGGDLVELELVNPYPEDYRAIVAQVARENETGFLPPLKTKVDISKYETIFLGFPTWGMQLPPPMKSFLHENDLSGKTLIPFNTNAGYGIGSSFDTVKELAPNSRILEGFSTRGGIERDGVLFVMEGEKEVEVKNEVTKWLDGLGFKKNNP